MGSILFIWTGLSIVSVATSRRSVHVLIVLQRIGCHPDFPFRPGELICDRQGPKTKEIFASVRCSLDSLTNQDDCRSGIPCLSFHFDIESEGDHKGAYGRISA